MRFGIGFDIHRLVVTSEKSTLALGGVEIPCFFESEAHSDGDVILHALVDGCLGALALGDIGQWFSDKDPKNHKRPSSEFIKEVMQRMDQLGWKVTQVDTNVFLEEPKLGESKQAIREKIASLLNIEISSVSVKAKTMEGLGPIGNRRAIAAQCLVVLSPCK
jgi:2-C-methyl-D-erythritol 2,4-cyclodiphosphate synthase